jgi:uncharacterized protein (TIGR03435 family)
MMMKPDKRQVERFLDQYLPSASKDEMAGRSAHVLQQLRQKARQRSESASAANSDFSQPGRSWWHLTPIRAVAAIAFLMLLLVPLLKVFIFPENVYAIVTTVTGSVYQVSDGKRRVLTGGERIVPGSPVHTSDNANAVLKLPGGSIIEMQPASELSLELATDGVNIRLSNGSVNITPAKEPAGKLYLQNREGTIPVVAAMFQSAAATQQESTSSSKTVEPDSRFSFEVASIRPSSPVPAGLGLRGGAAGAQATCADRGRPQIDPRRFAISGVTLYYLIVRAYGEWTYPRGNCGGINASNVLSGGPGWIRSDPWDIQAIVPEGTPVYTPQEFGIAKAPELQKMLQTLLEKRFKLVLRRETKEVPVFLLKVSKGGPRFNGNPPDSRSVFLGPDGKLVPASEMEIKGMIRTTAGKDPSGSPLTITGFTQVTMAALARHLYGADNRPVLDRTGLSGEFDFRFEQSGGIGGTDTPSRRSTADLLKEIGLELEEAKAPMEVWVIERAEKPSEN